MMMGMLGVYGSLPITDPNFSSTKLLLGFNGTNGAVSSSDESSAARGAATFNGNAQLSTANFNFGSSSLLLDGSFDCVTYPDSADWDLGAGLFTIECRIWTTTVAAGDGFIVAQWNSTGNLAWVLYRNGAALNWNVSTTGSDNLNDLAGGTLSTNTWTAVCVDYNGTKYRLYVNGAMVASSATARTIFNSGNLLAIGGNSVDTNFFFSGNIDELRITKGVARYASDAGYTVATAAFPRS
jgi:hypothetical protein